MGPAVPRSGLLTPSPSVGGATLLPSRPLPYVGFAIGSGLLFNPFLSPYGYGSYRAYGPFGYSSFGYGYPFTPYPFDDFDDSGQLRLQVAPSNAEVYVDGYYAGVVDDFDGHFQHLDLTPGLHRIEIVSPEFQPLALDITIAPHHKTTYRGALAPLSR